MCFVPTQQEWLRAHFVDVPNKTIAACGSLEGKSILDVGCGDMLSDFGLIHRGAAQVVGLDLVDSVDLANTFRKLHQGGLQPPSDYSRIIYQGYNGKDFPLEDESFDLVFSWGSFEHIADPLSVLLEMKRVCRKEGSVYVNVYPWWPSYHGSHLADYIREPFFHLRHGAGWVREQLDQHLLSNPCDRAVVDHIYGQFLTLNKLSATTFSAIVLEAGFQMVWCNLTVVAQDLSAVPPGVSPMDAVICGTEVVLRRAS